MKLETNDNGSAGNGCAARRRVESKGRGNGDVARGMLLVEVDESHTVWRNSQPGKPGAPIVPSLDDWLAWFLAQPGPGAIHGSQPMEQVGVAASGAWAACGSLGPAWPLASRRGLH